MSGLMLIALLAQGPTVPHHVGISIPPEHRYVAPYDLSVDPITVVGNPAFGGGATGRPTTAYQFRVMPNPQSRLVSP